MTLSNREEVREGIARVHSGQEFVKESLRAIVSREAVQAGFEKVHSSQELVKESLRSFMDREDVQAGLARVYCSQELVKNSLTALTDVENSKEADNRGTLMRVRRRDILVDRVRQTAEALKSLV